MKSVDAVAHCIAQDALMGAGIAITFERRYPGLRADLQSRNLSYPSVEIYDKKLTRPDVINLITKASSFEPPTYDDFLQTMQIFRNVVVEKGYKKLAMPMIGAGIDQLDWNTQVLPIIHSMFDDLDIELTICFTSMNADQMKKLDPPKPRKRK